MKRLIYNLFQKMGVHSKEEQKALIFQFIKFGLVGVSNTLVAWACYYLFLWIDEEYYMVGSVVGTIVSIANAFFWNDKLVFKSNKNDWKSKLKRLGITYISYGVTSGFSIVFMWVEVELCGVEKRFAPIINLAITIPLNFLINKYWIFRKDDD